MRVHVALLFTALSLPAQAERIIAKLEPTPDCKDGEAMAWLSQERTLYYHVDVPPQGELEFHALPGKYNLVVTSSKGCSSERVVDLKRGKELEFKLKLSQAKGGKS